MRELITKDTARALLGFVLVVGLVLITVYEIYTNGPNRNILVGAWIGYASAVVQFHYGSSRGSEAKNAMMEIKK